jgi:hypothetical protein
MALEPKIASMAAPDKRNRIVYVRLAIVLLLFAIAGFSTMAKNSQYYSRSNPVHFMNISSKMKVSPAPAILDRTPLQLVERLVAPPQQQVRSFPVVEQEFPELPSISVTLSLQHRSPPSFLS